MYFAYEESSTNPRFLHPNLQFREIAGRNVEGDASESRCIIAAKRPNLCDGQRACLAREEMENLSRIATRDRSWLGGLTDGHGRAESGLGSSIIVGNVRSRPASVTARRESICGSLETGFGLNCTLHTTDSVGVGERSGFPA